MLLCLLICFPVYIEPLIGNRCILDLIAAINAANGSAASEGEWESEASAAASETSGTSKNSPGADGMTGERAKRKRTASETSAPRTFTKEQQEAVQK